MKSALQFSSLEEIKAWTSFSVAGREREKRIDLQMDGEEGWTEYGSPEESHRGQCGI